LVGSIESAEPIAALSTENGPPVIRRLLFEEPPDGLASRRRGNQSPAGVRRRHGAAIAFPGGAATLTGLRRFNSPIAAKGRLYVASDGAVTASSFPDLGSRGADLRGGLVRGHRERIWSFKSSPTVATSSAARNGLARKRTSEARSEDPV
jgi:hypothetical protein